MELKEMEKRLNELKGLQSDVFKKKKADRDMESLDAIRKEMNELKAEVKKITRK